MKLSVVIPYYNCKTTINATVQSIYQQDYQNFEVVIVDDGSTDNGLVEISKQYPEAKIVRQINKGAAAARNKGIKTTTGDYILFVDSDVTLQKGGMSALAGAMSKNIDLAFPKIVYSGGKLMYPSNKKDEEYLLVSPIFVMKRKALQLLGEEYFDEEYRIYCEDTDFFLRCKLLGVNCAYVNNALAVHNVDYKPRNREGRYALEVKNMVYGRIKFMGFKVGDIDHAFKLSNMMKIYACGLFNYNLFDVQIHGFDKNGSASYKLKELLTGKNTITERSRLRLIWLSLKMTFISLYHFHIPLQKRRELRRQIKGIHNVDA